MDDNHLAIPERPDHRNIAGFAEAMIQHARLDISREQPDAQAEKEGLTRLY